MSIFKRVRDLEKEMLLHGRDHQWKLQTYPDERDLEKRIQQLERIFGRVSEGLQSLALRIGKLEQVQAEKKDLGASASDGHYL